MSLRQAALAVSGGPKLAAAAAGAQAEAILKATRIHTDRNPGQRQAVQSSGGFKTESQGYTRRSESVSLRAHIGVLHCKA